MEKERNANLRLLMNKLGIDALLVSRFFDILYLTGFKTLSPTEREAFVLVTKKHTYLFSDGRYATHDKKGVYDFMMLTPDNGLVRQLTNIILQQKIKKLGFDAIDLRWGEYDGLKKSLQAEMVPTDRVVLRARSIKDEEEINSIRRACEAGDRCLVDVAKYIRPGKKEKELAWQIEQWIREKGYELGFDPIVGVDENAAIPHYDTKSGNGIIGKSSLVLIDFGVSYKGYSSDITRMFFIGTPSPKIIDAYETLRQAQQSTIDHVSKLKKAKSIDEYCRQLLVRNKFPTYTHSTGHGIGLEVHEYPKVSSVSTELLRPGNVFTVEPGVYIPGQWGMRIEDTVAIDLKGEVHVLTQYPKTMRVL